jgi:hypothetical protein
MHVQCVSVETNQSIFAIVCAISSVESGVPLKVILNATPMYLCVVVFQVGISFILVPILYVIQ